MHVFARVACSTLVGFCLIPLVMGQEPAPGGAAAQPQVQRPKAKAQSRPNGQRVKVDPSLVVVEDGDTVIIRWPGALAEIVRILGIDTPEIAQTRAQPAIRPALRQGSARFRARGVRRRERDRDAQVPDPRPL